MRRGGRTRPRPMRRGGRTRPAPRSRTMARGGRVRRQMGGGRDGHFNNDRTMNGIKPWSNGK